MEIANTKNWQESGYKPPLSGKLILDSVPRGDGWPMVIKNCTIYGGPKDGLIREVFKDKIEYRDKELGEVVCIEYLNVKPIKREKMLTVDIKNCKIINTN